MLLAVPLDYYSTAALLLPVLFLAALVELRLSATTVPLEGERWLGLTARLIAWMEAVLALIVGEILCLAALASGGASSPVATGVAGCVVLVAAALVMPVIGRLRLEVRRVEQGGRALEAALGTLALILGPPAMIGLALFVWWAASLFW